MSSTNEKIWQLTCEFGGYCYKIWGSEKTLRREYEAWLTFWKSDSTTRDNYDREDLVRSVIGFYDEARRSRMEVAYMLDDVRSITLTAL